MFGYAPGSLPFAVERGAGFIRHLLSLQPNFR